MSGKRSGRETKNDQAVPSKYTDVTDEGCPLGEASAFLVRVGEYARVPVESGRDGCFRVCYCGTDGKLSSCTTLNCMLKKTCAVHGEPEPRRRPKRNHTPMFTSLPCGCSAEYQPVCASSGRTYPNPCIASCAGFKNSQVQKGSCETIDPCDKEPCKGQRFWYRRKV
ncbi:hypothetical protein QZH41_004402 [Actinostola sp. cb2023]|nr:hypothetical protein QZH41_004402 [Actinostola sp. cb2023]